MSEIWKAVVGWEGWYEVSDLGRVRSLPRATGHRGRVLRPVIAGARYYPAVALSRPGGRITRPIHRLVLETFVGPCPDRMEACHNNGDWDDCRLLNLRWDTRKANNADKISHGNSNRGAKHYKAKLTAEQAAEVRASTGSYAKLARRFGVSITCIAKIVRGESYAPLP